MRVKVTFELDSIPEAEEVIQAVKLLKDKPYRLKGFGEPVVEHDPEKEIDMYVESLGSKPDLDKPPTTRPNVSPGEPSISKIGSATQDLILADIRRGVQPPMPKYEEHCKLLWKRDILRYDNTTKEYYV